MGNFTKESVLNIGSNLVYGNYSRMDGPVVITLRVNDPSAYTISVSILNWKSKVKTLLYEKELDGGDTLTDTINYSFNQGDELYVTTNSATTACLISGIE